MLVPLLAGLLGVVLGFAGSRTVRRTTRRPARVAAPPKPPITAPGRRRGLTAPELQRACFHEMARHVRVDRAGTTTAPGAYLLRLHPDDVATVDEGRRWFVDGLATALRDAAAGNGWHLQEPVAIDIAPDPSRPRGAPAADLAGAPAGTTGPTPSVAVPSGVAGATLALRRADTGEQVVLVAEPVTIGRSRDRTITVADDRVSRAHARIDPSPQGWTITDEGSSNGTRVNGTPIAPGQPHPLQPGVTVSVGPLDLLVRAVPLPAADGPPSPPAGTRALDDATRSRISGEVLPPRDGPR